MSVTIKDVAKKANTSIATVSKVMHGSYSISKETADRVNSVMEELGYHPNQRARNFVSQSNHTIAFVTDIEKGAGFSNPHMFEMMCGMEAMLTQKGYGFLVKALKKNDVCEYVKNAFDTKYVDGFVIHASVITPELSELVSAMAIPHLVIGVPSFDNNFCWIDADNRHAGQIAAKHLLTVGYQTIAFIGGTDEDKISMHRLEGVKSVLKEHDVLLPPGYLQYGNSGVEDGYEMTLQILKSRNIPEAIICANNYLAYGCVKALNDKKIKIPEDIGIITFDDYPFSKILSPKLTVVNIDVYDMGQEAGSMIVQKINKPNLHIQSYITYPQVIKRESTK
ncbi:MAG: LacI family transcriptional regulator [Butyrivibrio sp.]|uniref:LacI family DNA-binding transcriptional regulator n=1 Tax=Butyrivibrio sp. TaxID=28121 RepID=UPI0025D161AC|nr:LacI family DNA-binding transcriptional regulator [Butyrivibrio sp.]MCR5772041.1 LacI family transcriptional regulator [Butyrivibrio sp.]